MLRIGITGGIGSGKTTVCHVFERLGVSVYDSDSRARALMNSAPQIVSPIKDIFGAEAYAGGKLNAAYIASKVFTDKSLLARLNGVVHPAVMEDFEQWAQRCGRSGARYVIQESAILFESGFDRSMDYSVCVSAPLDLRIARTAARSGMSADAVRERMANQMDDREREERADYVICNGASDMILPRIIELHGIFSAGKLSDGEHK